MDRNFDIVIEELGIKGDGVGRLPDGRRVFVAGALPGERVRAVLGQERAEGVTAKLVSVVEHSQDRAVPPCPHFGSCGGCALQHMSAEAYSRFKMNRVMEALARAGLQPDSVEGPIISPPGSRRRAVLGARCDADGTVHLGFNERSSHRLVEIGSCAVLKPALAALLQPLRAGLSRIMRPGESYDVALTESSGCIDLLITVLGQAPRPADAATRQCLAGMGKSATISRVSWQSPRLKPPVILYGEDRFFVRFGDFSVNPPPGAFLQATQDGEGALTDFAVRALPKKSRIADLYAGCGTFAFALLAHGNRVDAFEGDGPALDALARAGAGIEKLKAFKRDLGREPLTFQELRAYDAAIVDPPRTGAKGQMEEIGRSAISTVVSVSCSPDTFARDAAILVQKGFRMKRLRIVDQFLWTPHVELAGLFVR